MDKKILNLKIINFKHVDKSNGGRVSDKVVNVFAIKFKRFLGGILIHI